MKIPLSYSYRNLWNRRLTTVLTLSGRARVVFVLAGILMLAEGLQKTRAVTGSPENVVVIRKGATSEVMSGVERDKAALLEALPQVAPGPGGGRLLAKELVVLVCLPKKGSGAPTNVTIRGVGPDSLALRPQVRLTQGRPPRPGSSAIMTGSSVARKFHGTGLHEHLRFALRDWTVVGVFDAGSTGFNSEIWGDADTLMQAFRRPVYSSVIFRLRSPGDFAEVRSRIDGDPRLSLEAKRESAYYAEQSEMMARFLRILGYSLTVIFSVGAVMGAMITMYSAVASRTGEIGTLRALGFRRRGILAAFLLESVFLGLLGGVAGLAPAAFLQLLTVSTMNFQSFSDLTFRFTLTPAIALTAVVFALLMGLAGGLFAAVRASRMRITEALREA